MSTTNGKNGESNGSTSKGSNGSDDRSANGTFAKGHKLGGPGNPMSAKTHQFRALIAKSTTDAAMLKVWKKLTAKAQEGEPWAVKEFLDRTIGKPTEAVEISGSIDHVIHEVSAGLAKLSNRLRRGDRIELN